MLELEEKFKDALARGLDDQTATAIAITDNRGGSNRALSQGDEQKLGNTIRTMQPPATRLQMREDAVHNV